MKMLAAIMLVGLFQSCKSLPEPLPIPTPSPTPTPAPSPAPAPTVAGWIYCPAFLEHGIQNENENRLNAIQAAKNEMDAGHGVFGVELLAIRCNFEVLVLTTRYASEVDGHTVDSNDNWWWRARGMGMAQWCWRIQGNVTEEWAREICRRCAHKDNAGHLTWRLLDQPQNITKILKDYATTHGIAVVEGFPK